jgi:predicted phage tail protein
VTSVGHYVHALATRAGSFFVRGCTAALLVLIAASAAHAQYALTAAWDRNTDSTTVGYRLFYGTSAGNYQWNVDAGNNVTAPLNVPAGRYYFVVRAYNSAREYGPPSTEVSTSVGATTAPPTANIQASLQSSNTALVSWQTTNAVSATINGASVSVSGQTTIAVTASTTFTLTARSSTGATATASASVTVTPPVAGGPPLEPLNVRATVAGTRVTLSWQPNPLGGVPTEYLLYAGTSKSGSNIVRARSVGNVQAVSFDLRAGTYYARVRARNALGTSRSSTPTMFRVGATLAAPTDLTASWQGSQVTLSWVAGAADSAALMPTSYVVEAGSSPGMADLATIPIGTVTSLTADVSAGVYFVRVRGVSATGDSNPTQDIVVAAPGSAQAPEGFSAGGQGSRVILTWSPPAGGESPLGYIIEAGSDPGETDIAVIRVGNVTQFATDAPPGTYFVRIRAVNAKGPGLPSHEIVIQK